MAISTSALGIASRRKNIASRLEQQVSGLQETPWWKTVGSVALPFAATLAMPWLGGMMMAAGGGGGFLAGLGGALASSGGAMGSTGMLKGLLAKGAFQHLVKTGGRGAMEAIEGKSERDINLGTDPLDIALGQEAQTKLRSDYRTAKQQEGKTDITGTILSAIEAQGGLDAFKEAFKTEGAIRAAKGAGSMKDILALDDTTKEALKAFEKANPQRYQKISGKIAQGFHPDPTAIGPSAVGGAIGQSAVGGIQPQLQQGMQQSPDFPNIGVPGIPVSQQGGQQGDQSWIDELLSSIQSGAGTTLESLKESGFFPPSNGGYIK